MELRKRSSLSSSSNLPAPEASEESLKSSGSSTSRHRLSKSSSNEKQQITVLPEYIESLLQLTFPS